MIYITQLIYIKDNEELVFQQFENIAIPIISKYNGQLLLRIRPEESSIIEMNIERPYEIHIVQFDTDINFQNFMHDEDRKQFLHLKEQSIKSAILIKGEKLWQWSNLKTQSTYNLLIQEVNFDILKRKSGTWG